MKPSQLLLYTKIDPRTLNDFNATFPTVNQKKLTRQVLALFDKKAFDNLYYNSVYKYKARKQKAINEAYEKEQEAKKEQNKFLPF